MDYVENRTSEEIRVDALRAAIGDFDKLYSHVGDFAGFHLTESNRTHFITIGDALNQLKRYYYAELGEAILNHEKSLNPQ